MAIGSAYKTHNRNRPPEHFRTIPQCRSPPAADRRVAHERESGQYVHRGEPLLEVQPNPTPIELVEARRAIELREIELQQLDRRRDRLAELRDQELASEEEFEDAEYSFSEVSLQLQIARERLALLSGNGR